MMFECTIKAPLQGSTWHKLGNDIDGNILQIHWIRQYNYSLITC